MPIPEANRICEEQGLDSTLPWSPPNSPYGRKRLRKQQPMRFALVETGPARQQRATEPDLELVLATGERLRIGAGIDPTALRRVLEALRA